MEVFLDKITDLLNISRARRLTFSLSVQCPQKKLIPLSKNFAAFIFLAILDLIKAMRVHMYIVQGLTLGSIATTL